MLLEQLADLTGQELPVVLPEVTREAYLLDLLDQAAETAQRAGARLVLVVDGLDEDGGVTTGPDAHSIAGLLPATPSAGMRVIVAGRPSPPIPDDVPDWHPLRDRGIVRLLEDSPYARDVQRLGRQELQRLLRGTPAEQDLLGLLTAARGGLSGPDLEELTGTPLWEIEQVLHTVAGRTFTRRASQWAPGTGPEVYLLGHEELHTAATRYLGHRLASYHGRLHDWAGTYRARGWPPETPEYLLSGYFRLLTTLGDLSRMAACADDPVRHDRMLSLTGGDAAALTEVRTALDLIAARDTPDLACALRLAFHRDQLTARNTNIPASLPAVWAALGQPARAQALATSITYPGQRVQALVQVAEALAEAGQHQQAAAIAAEAEATARAPTDPDSQDDVLAQVAGALAKTGQHQQAEATARAITDSGWRAYALAKVAGALAGAGQHQQAEAIARAITNHYWQAEALAKVAETVAGAGQHQQAAALAAEAEAAARAITDPEVRADALARVAETLAGAGRRQRAAALAAEAEAAARAIADPFLQAQTLAQVAGALAGAGQYKQAEATARAITDSYWRTPALAHVAEALAEAGRHQQAAALAAEAEAAARAPADPDWRAQTLSRLAEALAKAGQYRQAEATARTITEPYWQAQALAHVAESLAKAGDASFAKSRSRIRLRGWTVDDCGETGTDIGTVSIRDDGAPAG